MITKRLSLLAMAGALAGAIPMGAQAVVIDSFEDPTFNDGNGTLYAQEASVDLGNGSADYGKVFDTSLPSGSSAINPSTGVSASGSDAIGGFRTLSGAAPSGDSDTKASVTAGMSDTSSSGFGTYGDLRVSNPGGAHADAAVWWNGGSSGDPNAGGSTTGLGGADLTVGGHNGFFLDVLSSTILSDNISVTISVWTAGGNGSLTKSVNSTMPSEVACSFGTPGCLFFPFLDFGTGLTFDNVGAIKMVISSNTHGYQFDAGYLATGSDINVPEPATLTLAGLGLMGMGWMRRRAAK